MDAGDGQQPLYGAFPTLCFEELVALHAIEHERLLWTRPVMPVDSAASNTKPKAKDMLSPDPDKKRDRQHDQANDSDADHQLEQQLMVGPVSADPEAKRRRLHSSPSDGVRKKAGKATVAALLRDNFDSAQRFTAIDYISVQRDSKILTPRTPEFLHDDSSEWSFA